MRIAVDARVLALPEIRGIGAYLMEILAAWPEAEDEFILAFDDGNLPDSLKSPARLTPARIPSPRGSRFHVWDMWALPRFMADRRADRLADVFWSPANAAFPVKSVPQVVTIHDTLLQELVPFKGFDRLYFRSVQPALARRFAGQILTVSDHAAGRVRDVFGLPAERINRIPNGATLPRRSFRDERALEELLRDALGVSCPYVYVLGAQSRWKNTAAALEAFALAARRHPDLRLVVSGLQEGVGVEMKNLALQLGIKDSVKLFGFISREMRDALYQGAEIFLYPSLFEGFGLPPLEAMALGTPVVASNAASIPEVVGDAALLVDARSPEKMAEAISRLADDKELRARMVRLGEERIRRFRWKDSAAAHREQFLRVV